MLLSLVAWSMLVSVQASEAERQLHRSLFDPEKYNPRVIIDGWRKANRGDYDNIGAFASDKCAGYDPPDDPPDSSVPGSLLLIDTFATPMPYKNGMSLTKRFKCYDDETVHLRLDQDQSGTFETALPYDYLSIRYSVYDHQYTLRGGISSLPEKFRQKNWFDTQSDYLEMRFSSDNNKVVKDGFKYDIMCKAMSQTDGIGSGEENDVSPTEATLTNIIITNEGIEGEVDFIKGVSCQSSSELIQYRLMREKIVQAEVAYFDEIVAKKLSLRCIQCSFNASDAEWVKTFGREVVVIFDDEVVKNYFDYYFDEDYDEDYDDDYDDDYENTPSDTFFFEFKCEQPCAL